MVFGFFLVILTKQYLSIFLVLVILVAVFKEVISIAYVPSKEKRVPLFRLVSWYFFLTTNYYLYGEALLRYYFSFPNRRFLLALPLATHHRLISYCLYCVGVVLFVLSLKKRMLNFQFSQFAWTHMAIILILVQGHAIIHLIFEGLIWFLVPCTLVICNDVFAYVSGFFFGKTPLIRLSPRKTWEGFIGGALCTLVYGYFVSSFLMQFPYFTCKPTDFDVSFWSDIKCETQNVFLKQPYFGYMIAPIQLHTLVLSLFASCIAPFGGFFASGVKRAFKIKDFGDVIPGHGGITDRFDCQFIMGFFSHMYITSVLGRQDVQQVIESILQLSLSDQKLVFDHLKQILN